MEIVENSENIKKHKKQLPKIKKLIQDIQSLQKGLPHYKPKFNFGLSDEIKRITPSYSLKHTDDDQS